MIPFSHTTFINLYSEFHRLRNFTRLLTVRFSTLRSLFCNRIAAEFIGFNKPISISTDQLTDCQSRSVDQCHGI